MNWLRVSTPGVGMRENGGKKRERLWQGNTDV